MKNRKKTIILILSCVTVFLMSFSVTGLIMTAASTGNTGQDAETTGNGEILADELASKSESTYIVRAYGRGIGVFFRGDEEPAIVADVDVQALREVDRIMLEEGIELSSYEEVLRLMEDFTS